MLEIHPLAPSYPVTKTVKINKDDNSAKKRFQENKPIDEELEPLLNSDQDNSSQQHIDERV
jgi:hypothetical protein